MISCYKVFLSIILILSTHYLAAQNRDTSTTRNIENALKDIDSLKAVVDSLNHKINVINNKIDGGNSFDTLITTLQVETDTSLIPEDQRSKRKQLDELLEYISKRPGQLFFNGQTLAIIQGNVLQNNRFATGEGSINLFASSSFGHHTILFIDFKAIGGKGPDEFSGTIGSLNGDASSVPIADEFDRFLVNEAWAEFLFLNNIFTVTAGKINLTNYFDNNAVANDPNSQFISGIFVNNAAFAVPLNSPGIRFRTSLLQRFYIQIAFAKAENTGSKMFTDIYKAAGFGFKLFPFTDFEANLHVFGYSHPFAGDRFGFGVSFDQTIAKFFKIFGRIGNNENILADWYGVKTSWSAGAHFEENILGEPTIIGIGYGLIKPADTSIKNEKSTELYLRQSLNKWISISTHLQHIWDTGGINGKYTLLGLRVNFRF